MTTFAHYNRSKGDCIRLRERHQKPDELVLSGF